LKKIKKGGSFLEDIQIAGKQLFKNTKRMRHFIVFRSNIFHRR